MATTGFYRLSPKASQDIPDQVRGVVSTWQATARELDISRVEIALMQRAFNP